MLCKLKVIRFDFLIHGFVEIDEDPTIRLGTNIVGCELDAIRVGMTVEVTFEENGDYFVPLFKPTGST